MPGFLLLPGSEVGEFRIADHAVHLGSQDTEVLIIEGSLSELATYLTDLLEQITQAQPQGSATDTFEFDSIR